MTVINDCGCNMDALIVAVLPGLDFSSLKEKPRMALRAFLYFLNTKAHGDVTNLLNSMNALKVSSNNLIIY